MCKTILIYFCSVYKTISIYYRSVYKTILSNYCSVRKTKWFHENSHETISILSIIYFVLMIRLLSKIEHLSHNLRQILCQILRKNPVAVKA